MPSVVGWKFFHVVNDQGFNWRLALFQAETEFQERVLQCFLKCRFIIAVSPLQCRVDGRVWTLRSGDLGCLCGGRFGYRLIHDIHDGAPVDVRPPALLNSGLSVPSYPPQAERTSSATSWRGRELLYQALRCGVADLPAAVSRALFRCSSLLYLCMPGESGVTVAGSPPRFLRVRGEQLRLWGGHGGVSGSGTGVGVSGEAATSFRPPLSTVMAFTGCSCALRRMASLKRSSSRDRSISGSCAWRCARRQLRFNVEALAHKPWRSGQQARMGNTERKLDQSAQINASVRYQVTIQFDSLDTTAESGTATAASAARARGGDGCGGSDSSHLEFEARCRNWRGFRNRRRLSWAVSNGAAGAACADSDSGRFRVNGGSVAGGNLPLAITSAVVVSTPIEACDSVGAFLVGAVAQQALDSGHQVSCGVATCSLGKVACLAVLPVG